MANRNRILIVSIIAVGALSIVVTMTIRPMQIAYHRWRFDVANEYMTNGPTEIDSNGFVGIDVTNVAPIHEHHMARLVELEEIAAIEYTLTNIRNDSPSRSKFAKDLLAGDCPPALYWMSDAPSDSTPMVLQVWCELENEAEWQTFLEKRNELAAKKPESGSRGHL
ncbi:MAG: hypothetical protein MI861_23245 [Pirellulales bacterium]|nr:hypothetical protein [Pirellulales bacterium]